jgi:hypothetical protein
VVNHHKPRLQTLVLSRYLAPAPVHDFVLLFLPPCSPHSTLLATGSLKLNLLVSPLLGGPARHRPFALAIHLHQRKSSRNLHLQYSAKSQSTPHCQSLIIARSDHPSVLGRSGPHHHLLFVHQHRMATAELTRQRPPRAAELTPTLFLMPSVSTGTPKAGARAQTVAGASSRSSWR